jgi:hypothetical protein
MNNLSMRKFFILVFFLTLVIVSCNAQLINKKGSGSTEKGLFRKSPGVKGPRAAVKAQKKQEAKDRKDKKDSAKAVKQSQKRTIDIQTPDVQARMKQNQKNTAVRDKEKKKKVKTSNKRAGKKYK